MDVTHKSCGHPGCNKQPTYGVEGTKTAELCSQHAREGMVNVISKRCGRQGCNKYPSFGVEGREKREYCAQHATPGMTNRRGVSIRSEGEGSEVGYSSGSGGRDALDADAPARRSAAKKPKRARQADSDRPAFVTVKPDEEREGATGSSRGTSTGNGNRAHPAGFTPTVPAVVKAEAARTRAGADSSNASSLGSESEPEAAAEAGVAVST